MNLMEDIEVLYRGFWNKIDSYDASLDSDEYIFVYFFFFFLNHYSSYSFVINIHVIEMQATGSDNRSLT